MDTTDAISATQPTQPPFRLCVPAFGLTAAIWWGLGMFLMTWWIIASRGASAEPNFVSMVYWGYTITPLGSAIGLAWGFVDGLVCGAVFAWLYNLLAAKLTKPRVE